MSASSSAKGIAKMKANLLAKAETYNHGDRRRYLAGCRCEDCTYGNTAYTRELRERHKAGIRVGTLVSAGQARRHLINLRRKGVGLRAVSECARTPRSTLGYILSGHKQNLREETARRILGVTVNQRSDGATVSAYTTWRLIAELREEGYQVQFLAKELGYAGKGIQFGKERVSVRTAARVARLHKRLTA